MCFHYLFLSPLRIEGINSLSVLSFANSFPGLSNELPQPKVSDSQKYELSSVPVKHTENICSAGQLPQNHGGI